MVTFLTLGCFIPESTLNRSILALVSPYIAAVQMCTLQSITPDQSLLQQLWEWHTHDSGIKSFFIYRPMAMGASFCSLCHYVSPTSTLPEEFLHRLHSLRLPPPPPQRPPMDNRKFSPSSTCPQETSAGTSIGTSTVVTDNASKVRSISAFHQFVSLTKDSSRSHSLMLKCIISNHQSLSRWSSTNPILTHTFLFDDLII